VDYHDLERIRGIKNKNKDSYKLMHTPLGNKKLSLPALDKLNPSQQAIHDEAWSACPFRDSTVNKSRRVNNAIRQCILLTFSHFQLFCHIITAVEGG
jgi:hypothetical protein